jgi:type I restriction enzyme M protein
MIKMTNENFESRLWAVANQLRANSKLSAAQYSTPVLGLIFLRHADYNFTKKQKELEKENSNSRRTVGKADYHESGVLYLPEEARYSYLLNLPEGQNIGKAVDNSMKLIEQENSELKETLPKSYTQFDDELLVALLKTFSKIQVENGGDIFGKIYEYFLGKFAMSEGQKGGEFFTPTSLVRLIVEIIEPYHGRILDPACGSGGMFVQSGKFVEKNNKVANIELTCFGQEKITDTVKLGKMNLAVHGLTGDIKEGNTFYEDIHESVGKFDFVMANPPFNVHGVDYEKVKSDPRWSLGLPSTDNANYLWIQTFWSALNDNGRAGFVMANSAADARGNESAIREKLIKAGAVDVMISIGSNFFYTVTLPCTLWFLDKTEDRKDKVLFIDARKIFRQIDRAHREFTPAQIEYISRIVRLYRGEDVLGFDKVLEEQKKDLEKQKSELNSDKKLSKEDNEELNQLNEYIKTIDEVKILWVENFSKGYNNIKGLCKIVSVSEIEEQEWSLNPGRYVGIEEVEADDFDFKERLQEYNEELQKLNAESKELEEQIELNIEKLLGN